MKQLSTDTIKFAGWTVVTVSLAASLTATSWPAVRSYTQTEADQLVNAAAAAEQAGQGTEASVNYRLAYLLDNRNPAAAERRAADVLQADPARAVTIIERAGDWRARATSAELLVRGYLEASRRQLAAEAARALVSLNPTEAQTVTIALALAAAGQGSDIASLVGRVSSPQAVQALARAQAGKLALAEQLALSGLPNSSSGVLEGLPSSAPRDLLLARLKAARQDRPSHEAAAALYAAYLKAMPADASARLSYAAVLDQIGQSADANHQRELATKLKAGRP